MTMPSYSERAVVSKPRDYALVANNAGSGGVVNNNVTESINNVTVTGSLISIFSQEFLATISNVLTYTKNNGLLPTTNTDASIQVYQNGQKLIASQYTITQPDTITIDVNTHYDGANYIIFAIIIN
jgi:predicted nucleic acid-binding protein